LSFALKAVLQLPQQSTKATCDWQLGTNAYYNCQKTSQLPQKRRGYAYAELPASDVMTNEAARSS
jgi:hypothetical protein